MSTPIINAQMDAINGTMATLKGDLTTLRPLIKTLKETALNAYPTESLSNQAVASFTDGAKNIPVKSLSVGIEPVQNLNGQQNPYPAGGGKNKLPYDLANIKVNNTLGTWSGNVYTHNGITFTVNDDGTIKANGTASSLLQLIVYKEYVNCPFNGYILNGCPSGGGGTTYDLRVSDVDATSSIDAGSGTTINLTSTGKWQCVILIRSGATVSNLVFSPMIRLATETDPTFAPYSNICPISGWSGAEVYRTGENLFDASLATLGARLNTSGYTFSDANYYCTSYISVEVGKTYFKNSPTVDAYHRWWTYNANKTPIRKVDNSNTITIESGEAFVRFCGLKTEMDSTYCSINGTYETYPISWQTEAGTVYGGTLDVTTGVLTITHERLNMGSFTYGYSSPYFYTSVTTKAAGNFNIMSDAYKTATQGSASLMGNNEIKGNATTYNIYVTDSRYTDPAAFKTAVNGIYMVFELATPTTVQLTPTEVTTLLGQNNIWADTGDILEVTIRCDTALYIQKLVG